MAERVGKETVRLATTAGSEFCRLVLEPRAWDSKDRSYRRQQGLKSCDCQQDRFLERNLGIGEQALGTPQWQCSPRASPCLLYRLPIFLVARLTRYPDWGENQWDSTALPIPVGNRANSLGGFGDA